MAWTPEYIPGGAEPVNHTAPQVDDKYGVAFTEYLRANLAKVIDILGFWHSIGNSPTGQQGFSKQWRAGNSNQGVTPNETYGVHEIFHSINVPSNQATTAVKLDDSIDWRKRWITLDALYSFTNSGDTTNHFAGQADDGSFHSFIINGAGTVLAQDGSISESTGTAKGWFYSSTGLASNALPTAHAVRFTLDSSSDELWLAVSNGTGTVAAGALFVIYKTNSASQSSAQLNAFIKCSMKQVA